MKPTPDTSEQAESASPQTSSPTLQDYLAHREEACPSCRYNLRGLRGNNCPECGVALTLRVGLMEPRLFGLIAALVSASLMSGIGWFFLIGISLDDSIIRFYNDEPIGALTLLAMLILGTGGLLVLIVKRRKLYAISQGKQITLAITSLILAIGLMATTLIRMLMY